MVGNGSARFQTLDDESFTEQRALVAADVLTRLSEIALKWRFSVDREKCTDG